MIAHSIAQRSHRPTLPPPHAPPSPRSSLPSASTSPRRSHLPTLPPLRPPHPHASPSQADGELGQLVATPSLSSQLVLYGVAALGGVRFLTQLLALRVMSPTSLSVANVGAHLLVAAISFGVLHVYVNTAIVLGFVITLGALLGYVYVVVRHGAHFDEARQGPNCCEVVGAWFTQQLHGRREGPAATGHPVGNEAGLRGGAPSEAEALEAKKT